MERHGLTIPVNRTAPLDPAFLPLLQFNRAFLAEAKKPVAIAVERAGGQTAVCHTYIHGTKDMEQADHYYIDRLTKTLLWMKGGWRIYVCGDEGVFRFLSQAYSAQGERAFDGAFMADIFQQPFSVVPADEIPPAKESPRVIGGHLTGCRIGFDAGGSDRKVSAVMDGETVYSEEVVWHPKIQVDPDYHYKGILAALRSAASHLPRVDAVGVSSAGIFLNNRVMNASLFRQVPRERFEEKGRDIYIRAIRDAFGDIPFEVTNDGDVTALAGAMSLQDNGVLGIAMGTSEAGGFVNGQGCITGWLNELAYMPVDASPEAPRDAWSGDIGCGEQYLSQEAVIRLASRAGIRLDSGAAPAERLREVQQMMEKGSSAAARIYETMGVYLGHTLAHYHALYGCRHVLLLGRVMSGRGGDLLLDTARQVLREDYPELTGMFSLELPDERFRRVGQSMAAASLPARKEGAYIC